MEDLVGRLSQKIRSWLGPEGPARFVRDVFGVSPTHQQLQLLEAIGSGKHRAIAIRSGHGTGKSASLSWLIVWFLITRPGAKVLCTAPTRRQLFDILWAEMRMWLSRAVPFVKEILEVKSEVVHVKGRKDWFARACAISTSSSPEEQAETLAGYHHRHFLCIVDEASGVPDPVFQPIEGYLTQDDNFVVLAGNPTRPYGYFYEIFHDPAVGDGWLKLHWNSEESPLVSRDWLRRMERYGRHSDTYRVRVLGEFPLGGSHEAIPAAWVEKAIVEDKAELLELAHREAVEGGRADVWGLDVARFGEDESVLVKRCGCAVWDVQGLRKGDSVSVADWVAGEWEKFNAETGRMPYVVVDSTGVGAGVVDLLRRMIPGYCVVEIMVGWKSGLPEMFGNVRNELWWRMRRAFEFGVLRIPNDAELVRQLQSVRMEVDDVGRWKIESKKQMSKRGIGSPDRADALSFTFWIDDLSHLDVVPVRTRQVKGGMGAKQRRRRRHVGSWRVA